ncbi:MAG: CPBP family glutamic-type intramembrane protease [Bacteroidetes bacterium]|nr:CPBP family glutamic-type intramembrane protease [Bacteroidota bacterium]
MADKFFDKSNRPLVDAELDQADSPSGPILFDGVSGKWPTFAVLALWVFVGLIAYLFIGNLASVILLALGGVELQDLVANQQAVLAEYGSALLGANAIGLALGLGGIAILASWLDSSQLTSYLRISRCTVKELVLCIVGFFCLLPIVLGLGIFNEQLPLPEFLQTLEEQQMEIVDWLASGGGNFYLNLVFVAATPAIFEEVFFRGFVQRRAERGMGIVGGILFTGFLFGLFHLRLTQVLPLALLGCYLAYVTWHTGSLLIPVVLHFLNNGLSLVVSEWGSTSISDPESIPWSLIVGGALAFLICIRFIHQSHGQRHSHLDDWTEVFRSGTDYEAALVHARLEDADIPSVILNQRDHAFNLTHGYLAKVRVLVPKSMENSALEILSKQSLTDEELTQEALKNK